MDFYKTLRHPQMTTPRYIGFEWPHKLFSDGKPRSPWQFITEKDSKEILDVHGKSYWDLHSKILEEGDLKGKVVHKYKNSVSIRPEHFCQSFEQLDAILQDYGKGVNCRTPFNNPLGAPVAAIKSSVTESSAVPGLLVMVYIPEDKKYCRAEITEIKGPNERMVSLYDRGLGEEAKLENIYHLPHRFDFSITPAHVFIVNVFNSPNFYSCLYTTVESSPATSTNDSIEGEVATTLELFLARHFSLNRMVHFASVKDLSARPIMFGLIAYPLERMVEEFETFAEETKCDQRVKQKIQDFLPEMCESTISTSTA